MNQQDLQLPGNTHLKIIKAVSKRLKPRFKPVTDQEVDEVELGYQIEQRYGKKLEWNNRVECDVCGKKKAALCHDDIYRCIGCIDKAFPEEVKEEGRE